MSITRIKEDITAISYEILRRNGISVKFKVKTYSEFLNSRSQYYYTTYVYNSKNNKKYSININPISYIQFDFGSDDGKAVFFLSEVYKNRFVRKLAPLVKILDDYDNGDIDIIQIDKTGTHIDSRIKPINIKLGINSVVAEIIIREDKIDIGVSLTINSMNAILSMNDFIDLISKINSINYIELSLLLLNHVGPSDPWSNMIDFRPTKIMDNSRDGEINSIAPQKSSINSLNKNSINSKSW